jgi:hypothetical protein
VVKLWIADRSQGRRARRRLGFVGSVGAEADRVWLKIDGANPQGAPGESVGWIEAIVA